MLPFITLLHVLYSQDTISRGQSTSIARDSSAMSPNQSCGSPRRQGQESREQATSRKKAETWGSESGGTERGERGARGFREAQRKHVMGVEEREASQAMMEEEERKSKEAHRMELEAGLAGDLDRQWREIAEQRKLRAQVSSDSPAVFEPFQSVPQSMLNNPQDKRYI